MQKHFRPRWLLAFALLALFAAQDDSAEAQRPGRPFFDRPLADRPLLKQIFQPRLEIELFAGEPFGVGRAVIPLPGLNQDADLQLLARVADRQGRVCYPAYEVSPVGQIVRDVVAAPPRATVYFLFRGAAPLELTQPVPQPIQPRVDPAGYQRTLAAWWGEYSGSAGLLPRPPQGPSDVRNYLTWLLGKRLGLPLPAAAAKDGAQPGEITRALSLLTGADAMRETIVRDVLAGSADDNAAATIPLAPRSSNETPNSSEPRPEAIPAPGAGPAPAVETIAMHVPEECLYVRFGNFKNFLWLRQRIAEAQGALANFVIERGVDTGAHERLEDQLCAHQSELAPVMGPQVIEDVAFLGMDTFEREGAALGVLFHAKNNALLKFDLSKQRSEALKRDPTAKEEKVQIGALTASFVHSPDNRIRSFYVQDGDFHLLTTSRAIAERFVAAGKGDRPLGAAEDFRQARAIMPIDKDYTAFVFLSDAFQRNLLSPRYQIEMVRRWRSAAEMQLLQLARLAARGEGAPADSTDQLIAGGYLPPGFGRRADGSALVETPTGFADSLRGRQGTFTPAPDTPITQITPGEARSLERLRQAQAGAWERLDPVLVGVERVRGQTDKLERIVVQAYATPLSDLHYQLLAKWLGAPLEQRLASIPGDQISFQASLRGGTPISPNDHLFFGALRDGDATYQASGIGALLLRGQDVRGYLGAYPGPGILNLIGGGAGGPVDPAGYSKTLLGVWRRLVGPFTLMSFHRESLDEVAPQLRLEPVNQPAHGWLHVTDLSQAKLSGTVNRLGFKRALAASRGGAHFINSFTDQLRVPPEQALATADRLIDAKLIDPLGGEYALRAVPSGVQAWLSTVDDPLRGSDNPPADYQFPAVKWIHGLDAQALLRPESLIVHAELELPVLAEVSGVAMPSLPALSSLPFSFPGLGAAEKKPAESPAAPEP